MPRYPLPVTRDQFQAWRQVLPLRSRAHQSPYIPILQAKVAPPRGKMCKIIEQYRECPGCGNRVHVSTSDTIECNDYKLLIASWEAWGRPGNEPNCKHGLRTVSRVKRTLTVCVDCRRRGAGSNGR